MRSLRLLAPRLARENSSWEYRRVHGELLVLGVRVDASTVWEILQEAGIDPAPERATSTWAAFLRCQAGALLPALLDTVLNDAGSQVVLSAVRMPRWTRSWNGGCGPADASHWTAP